VTAFRRILLITALGVGAWLLLRGGCCCCCSEDEVEIMGNPASQVFHRRGCRYFSLSLETEAFSSPGEAVAAGYRPCGVCGP